MKFKNWKEYFDDRGNMVEKPKVEKIADYNGPDSKSPVAGDGQKVLGDKNAQPIAKAAKVGQPAPYKSANGNEKPVASKEKGLAGTGDQTLVYEPETDIKGGENMPGGKTVANAWPKTKTEQFLQKTQKMGMNEFAKYVLEGYTLTEEEEADLPTVTAYTAGKFHPHPPEVIRYITALVKNNSKILEALVHELKNSGCMGDLLKTSLSHPEANDELAGLLGDEQDGPMYAGGLARAMDGKYKKFMTDQEEMYESVGPPFGEPPSEEEPEEGGEGAEGPDGVAGPEGSESEDGQEGGEEAGKESHPDDPDAEFEKEEDDGMEQEKPAKKLKKKFAHHHMIDAMSGYDHMKDHMKGL